MFYVELGNIGIYDTSGNFPQLGWGLTNTIPFTNFSQLAIYWSGTDYGIVKGNDPTGTRAWIFNFDMGAISHSPKDFNRYAWAVRDGAATPIPETATIFLLGTGLLGLVGASARRRFKKAKE